MSRWSDAFVGLASEPEAMEPQQVGRWSDQFEGVPGVAPKREAKPQASNGNFITRTWDSIKGKQDPQYKDVPALDDGGSLPFVTSTAIAKLGGAEDPAYGDVMQKSLGDKFIRRFTDANGYEIIEWNDNGKSRLGYVNKPGLDLDDVNRSLMGAVPYIGGGMAMGAATKGAPMALRGIGQAGTAGATSIVGDMASGAVGSERGIDQGKAALTMALGGAAEVLPSKALMGLGGAAVGGYLAAPETKTTMTERGPVSEPQGEGRGVIPSALVGGAAGVAIATLARRLMLTQPGTFARDGKLTPAGEEAAARAGFDPKQISAEIADQFDRQMIQAGGNPMSRSGQTPKDAMITTESFVNRIPLTRGEVTGDKGQLLKEQQLRSGNYGQVGADMVKGLDQAQREAIEQAALGAEGHAARIAPGVAAQNYKPADLGNSIRGRITSARAAADEAASKAWKEVPPMKAGEEALASLPKFINDNLGPLPDTGKASGAMVERITAFMGGKAPAKTAEWRTIDPTFDVGQMRKDLLKLKNAAADKTDAAAANAIYRGFNEWVEDAAQKLMLGGDPMAAAKMQTARSITARLHADFDGEAGTAAARIIEKVTRGADSGEGIVNSLFTAPASQIKDGAVDTVKQLRSTFHRYLPREEAKAAWDEVRLAYYLRMVQDGSGELMKPQKLASSIKNTFGKQGSLAETLFTPGERAQILSYARTVERAALKNPNTSWSGIAAAGWLKDAGNAVLAAIGGNTFLGKMAINTATKPLNAIYGQTLASGAVRQGGPGQRLNSLGGYGGAVGSIYAREN